MLAADIACPVKVINMKPQEVITIFRELKTKDEEKQLESYPELDPFFEKDYYIESFNQTVIGNEKYMITFVFRQYHPAQY